MVQHYYQVADSPDLYPVIISVLRPVPLSLVLFLIAQTAIYDSNRRLCIEGPSDRLVKVLTIKVDRTAF